MLSVFRILLTVTAVHCYCSTLLLTVIAVHCYCTTLLLTVIATHMLYAENCTVTKFTCNCFDVVSAFYVECPEKNICMNCHIWTKSKFYGMSIGVELIGDGEKMHVELEVQRKREGGRFVCVWGGGGGGGGGGHYCKIRNLNLQGFKLVSHSFNLGVLTLLNHDEEYVLTFPNAYCR